MEGEINWEKRLEDEFGEDKWYHKVQPVEGESQHDFRDRMAGDLKEMKKSNPENPEVARAEARSYLEFWKKFGTYKGAKQGHVEKNKLLRGEYQEFEDFILSDEIQPSTYGKIIAVKLPDGKKEIKLITAEEMSEYFRKNPRKELLILEDKGSPFLIFGKLIKSRKEIEKYIASRQAHSALLQEALLKHTHDLPKESVEYKDMMNNRKNSGGCSYAVLKIGEENTVILFSSSTALGPISKVAEYEKIEQVLCSVSGMRTLREIMSEKIKTNPKYIDYCIDSFVDGVVHNDGYYHESYSDEEGHFLDEDEEKCKELVLEKIKVKPEFLDYIINSVVKEMSSSDIIMFNEDDEKEYFSENND